MDISAITNISSDYIQAAVEKSKQTKDQSFDNVFQSMLGMVGETNELQNDAESAEIQFALGESVNTHDLQIAQEKANVALQYTVAVRDKVLEAYKEIMNMQI
ncbi:MAG: flagellar hook-basal body complex protein FliE [Lachnospiraceae bacterium]